MAEESADYQHAVLDQVGHVEFYDAKVDACITFRVPKRYVNLLLISSSQEGTVCGAYDTMRQQKVAIKLKYSSLREKGFAKVAYKEFCLIKKMNHKNVAMLFDAFVVETRLSTDFYLVTELMDESFDKALSQESKPLTHRQISYRLCQILSGINYLHSFGIILRNLKPCHVGVYSESVLKLLDFGLSKGNTKFGLQYVSPAPYQAPEIILMNQFSEKSDVWSVGCIHGEMVLNRSVFQPSTDHLLTRWHEYVKKLGLPSQDFMSRLPEPTKKYLDLNTLRCIDNEISFDKLFPEQAFPPSDHEFPEILNTKMAKDLLARMLTIDPQKRISVSEALNHPYMSLYPRFTYDKIQSAEDDKDLPADIWKHMLIEEVENYRKETSLLLINNQVTVSNQATSTTNDVLFFDSKYQQFYNFKTGYYTNCQGYYLYKPDTRQYFYWRDTAYRYLPIDNSFIEFVLSIENSSRTSSH